MSRPPSGVADASSQPDLAPPYGSADWRTGAVIALVFAVFFAGFTHARFKSTDETGIFEVTRSLYERHSLEVPLHRHAHVGVGNRLYSPFAVGQSVLALPLFAVAKGAGGVLPESWSAALAGPQAVILVELDGVTAERMAKALPPGRPPIARLELGGTLEIFFVGLYPAILAGLMAMGVFVLLRRLDVSPRTSLVTTFLICACSYPAMHSVYFLRHTGETVCVLFAFIQLRHFRETGATHALAIGCALASLTFLIRFPGVLAGPAVGMYVAHVVWKRHGLETRSWIRDGCAVVLPLVTGLSIHAGLNFARWGSLLESPMVAGALERSESFTTALSGFLFSPGIGVFVYSPLLLLSPWTFRFAWQRWPWESAAVAIYALTQLIFFSNYRFWTGLWSAPGPRYLLPACVFMLISLAAWLDQNPGRRARISLAGLAAAGALSQFVMIVSNWSAVIVHEDYAAYDPLFSFLFMPSASPILGSARAIANGMIDTWLWKLAIGWPGHPPALLAACSLALVWLTGSALGAWLLWRRVRPPAIPPANV